MEYLELTEQTAKLFGLLLTEAHGVRTTAPISRERELLNPIAPVLLFSYPLEMVSKAAKKRVIAEL